MNTKFLSIIFLILAALISIVIAVVPAAKNQVKALLKINQREILAKAQGSLFQDGPQITVLKIKENEGLFLEIYKQDLNSELQILSKIRLDETRDAHFTLRGNATNLALSDMDGDGSPEIFAPAFDEQMVARLNIYKYNKDSNSFDRINSNNADSIVIK